MATATSGGEGSGGRERGGPTGSSNGSSGCGSSSCGLAGNSRHTELSPNRGGGSTPQEVSDIPVVSVLRQSQCSAAATTTTETAAASEEYGPTGAPTEPFRSATSAAAAPQPSAALWRPESAAAPTAAAAGVRQHEQGRGASAAAAGDAESPASALSHDCCGYDGRGSIESWPRSAAAPCCSSTSSEQKAISHGPCAKAPHGAAEASPSASNDTAPSAAAAQGNFAAAGAAGVFAATAAHSNEAVRACTAAAAASPARAGSPRSPRSPRSPACPGSATGAGSASSAGSTRSATSAHCAASTHCAGSAHCAGSTSSAGGAGSAGSAGGAGGACSAGSAGSAGCCEAPADAACETALDVVASAHTGATATAVAPAAAAGTHCSSGCSCGSSCGSHRCTYPTASSSGHAATELHVGGCCSTTAATAAATAVAAARQQHLADSSKWCLHGPHDADYLLSSAPTTAAAAAASVVRSIPCAAANAGAAAAADAAKAAASASTAAGPSSSCSSCSCTGGLERGLPRSKKDELALTDVAAAATGAAATTEGGLNAQQARQLQEQLQQQAPEQEHQEREEQEEQQERGDGYQEQHEEHEQRRLPRSQKKLLTRENYRQKKRQQRPEERRKRRKKRNEQIFEGLVSSEDKSAAMKAHKERLQKEKEAFQVHLEECMKDGVRICFNCSFDSTMQDKEIRSLAKQLFLSYHHVKRTKDTKIQLHLSSFVEGSPCRVACENLFAGNSWLVHRHEEPYWQCFSPDEIVVLSPDASEELLDVDPSKVFVIGGLVDRTISKGLSFSQAEELGLTCRKLPFKTFLPEKQRVVLNVNSVLEALMLFLKNRNWGEALAAVLPNRMQGSFGRKQQRILKKRARVEELSRIDAAFAAAQVARRARESQWCCGRGMAEKVVGECEDAFESGFGIEALEFAASDTRANGAPEDAVLPACEANPLLT